MSKLPDYTQIDLSPTSWIKIINDFVSVDTEQFAELWNLMPNKPSYIKLFGKTIATPRLHSLFGHVGYTFSGITMDTRSLDNQIMINLLNIINKMEPDFQYNGIFVNWY